MRWVASLLGDFSFSGLTFSSMVEGLVRTMSRLYESQEYSSSLDRRGE
jgi:hypothetical protein